MIFCQVDSRITCANAEPSAEPIWMIGPSRPTAAPLPIESRRGQRLDEGDLAADVAAFVEDSVHDLGYAMSLGLRRKLPDEIDDDEAADDRAEKHPVAEPARRLRDIGIVDEAQPAVIGALCTKRDQRPESDRTKSGHDPDHQRKSAQRQKADRPLVSRFRSVDPDQFGVIGGGGSYVGHRSFVAHRRCSIKRW